MDYLKKLFNPGMTWGNYGKCHIYHVTPKSCKTVHDKGLIECWAITNLQPLWASENIKKGNRYHG